MKTLKSILAVMLSLLLFATPLSVAATENADNLDFFLVTDTHYAPNEDIDPDMETSIENDMFFYAERLGKMRHESTAIIHAMLNDVASSDAPYLLIAGDLCDKALVEYHENMRAMLKEFETTTGKKVFVVPGNHDLTSAELDDETLVTYNEFEEIYADFGYNEALNNHDASASYTVDLNDEYRLIAIDSITYGKTSAGISEETLAWIEQQVESAKADGKRLIAMMHHSLLNHFILNTTIVGGYDTISADKLAVKFAEWGIKYTFTGHLHVNDITSAVTDDGVRVYDVCTGSLAVAPCMYRHVSFADKEVEFKSHYVTEIDPQYLGGGYTQEQLDYLTSDFVGYSTDYSHYGFYNWVTEFISAGKIFPDMDPESPVYKAIDSALGLIRDLAVLPLYDNGTEEIDSLEEIGALGGAKIPESNYETVVDVAAVIVHNFYSGEQEFAADSTEVQLAFYFIRSAIPYIVGRAADLASLSVGVSALLEKLGLTEAASSANLTADMSKIMYAETLTATVIFSVLTPIIESFTSDSYDPGNFDVVLEGYGVNESFDAENAPITFIQKIIAFFNYLLKVLKNIVA